MTTNDLSYISNAFGWVNAYFQEIAKFCGRVRSEFESCSPQYTCLSKNGVEWPNSKLLSGWRMWLPSYHYQFFMPASVIAEEGEEGDLLQTSLLAVSVQHYQEKEEVDVPGPRVFLVRFAGERWQLNNRKNDIVYNWDAKPAHEEERAGWRYGAFGKLGYSYKIVPLSGIASLDDVKPQLVAPLVEHDGVQTDST